MVKTKKSIPTPSVSVFHSRQHIDNDNTGYDTVTLGIDTEFLFTNKDGSIVWPWIAGFPQERKLNHPTTGDNSAFDFHGDGYATELCTSPFSCLETFVGRMGSALSWLQRESNASSINAPPLYTIPATVVKSAPGEAKLLGCMPSMNVYGDSGKPTSLKENVRTTGCHLHVSHSILKSTEVCANLVKWADILVGSTWTYISPNTKTSEARRRKAYGRAGEFRLKDYGHGYIGVEYRVLPGTPIHHPAFLTLMFNLYRHALYYAINFGEPDKALTSEAKIAINTANAELAEQVIMPHLQTSRDKQFLQYLHKTKLQPLNLDAWIKYGVYGNGHQHLAYNLMNKRVIK